MALRKGTEVLAALEETWENELIPAAVEEMMIADDFRESAITGKFGDTLNISKIPSVAASTLSSSATGLSLTSTDPTLLNVTASPTYAYAAAYIADNVLTDMLRSASLRNGIRKQLSASLATKIDVDAGTLAAAVSSVAGGAGEHVTKVTLLDAITLLAAASKNKWKPGKVNMRLKIHPTEIKHLLTIADVTAANLRGDSQNPNVKGWVWDAYGCNIAETGNIYSAAGINHNMLFLPDAFAIAYNQRPAFMPDQYEELQFRIITRCSFAVVEVFDEYAVDYQTAA